MKSLLVPDPGPLKNPCPCWGVGASSVASGDSGWAPGWLPGQGGWSPGRSAVIRSWNFCPAPFPGGGEGLKVGLMVHQANEVKPP